MNYRAKILSKRSQACRRSWRFGLNCFREMKVSLYIVFGGSKCQKRQMSQDFPSPGAILSPGEPILSPGEPRGTGATECDACRTRKIFYDLEYVRNTTIYDQNN